MISQQSRVFFVQVTQKRITTAKYKLNLMDFTVTLLESKLNVESSIWTVYFQTEKWKYFTFYGHDKIFISTFISLPYSDVHYITFIELFYRIINCGLKKL